jgi:hypothetical protein
VTVPLRQLLASLEHFGSDLDSGRSNGDNGAFIVKEFPSEKANVPTAPNDASSS